MKKKKKVLIITYYWPPSGGAGVQRWLKFAKYLPGYGWQPVVYTPENPEAPTNDESLSKDIHPEVQVIKKPIWEPYTWYKRFTGKDKNQRINAGFLQEKKSNRFLENISVFIRGNLFIPDARKFWIKPSVKFLTKYLKENHIDVVVSTGPPHSMHLIALEVKKILDVKWIADFRDPWTNIDFYKDLKLTRRSDKKHKRLEREVLRNADVVLSVGETMGEELEQLGAKKIQIITNGFDAYDIPEIRQELDVDFSIVHVGSINKDRNHEVFWQAIEELVAENEMLSQKLVLKFIGKLDHDVFEQVERRSLTRNFKYIEYIAHDQIMRELMKARLLYLPINKSPNAKGIITGKFFEYLAAKRPVLVIGPKDSDVQKIIDFTNSGQVFDFENRTGIKNYIRDCFSNYIEHNDRELKTNVDEFSRKNLTGKLSAILEELSHE